MPPELLAEIFFFCLPFDKDMFVDPDPADAPLVLCAVCRQWRSIALTTSKLWSSIYFDCDRWAIFETKSEAEEAALYVEVCRDWIARARSTPLSLQLYANVYDGAGSVVDSLLEIIGGVSQQWQNIDIDIGKDLPLPFPGNGKYPLLEKLNVSSPPPDRSVLSFRDAPRLHDVFIPTYTTRIELPWHQLTKFGTERMDIEACLDLLRHASNLVDAHLRILPYDASTLLQTIFSLPQLHSLNLSGAAWSDDDEDMSEMMPMTLFKCLKTPALKTLALGFENVDIEDSTDISPFLSFVSQSSFQLDTLVLSLVPHTTDALIKCLKATPSVIRLKLQISHQIVDADPLFVQLTDDRDFLPKLESLSIALSSWRPNIDALVVVNMLLWRCIISPVTRLQSFRFLEDSIKSHIKAHPAYLELEASGIDLGLGTERYYDEFMHLP
ncbi:hypothetical protein DFH08DRAFT_756752 [Mycena albidolilacea]|uniref:F-box domain-containing protein n=1 Tax=Mycena albidolilacea TaxID=1033008 RepID=A0AAD6Z8C0_9AGAR|nr:hypothetical protein DFH08DRAFT_756752 [Mycena albidolilacea]